LFFLGVASGGPTPQTLCEQNNIKAATNYQEIRPMISYIIQHIYIIAGTALSIIFTAIVAYIFNKKSREAEAAKTFRNKVLSALEGVYPEIVVYIPTDEINVRIRQSIPIILTAATQFKFHLPFYRKRGFGNAINHYSDIARQTDWHSHHAYLMFPTMHKPEDISPGDKFKHSVNNLLSYAKEK
jgi:hypothetical protein